MSSILNATNKDHKVEEWRELDMSRLCMKYNTVLLVVLLLFNYVLHSEFFYLALCDMEGSKKDWIPANMTAGIIVSMKTFG